MPHIEELSRKMEKEDKERHVSSQQRATKRKFIEMYEKKVKKLLKKFRPQELPLFPQSH